MVPMQQVRGHRMCSDMDPYPGLLNPLQVFAEGSKAAAAEPEAARASRAAKGTYAEPG